MARRKQKSCHQCRSRHLKCDGEQPCMHCRRGARQCSKDDNVLFLNESNLGIVRRKKRYDLQFDGNQRWMDLPSVRFADSASANSSTSGDDTSNAATPAQLSSSTSARCTRGSRSPGNVSIESVNTANSSQSSFPLDPRLQEPCDDAAQTFSRRLVLDEVNTSRTPSPFPCTAGVQWPFRNYQEALLMRHFTQELSLWFDSVDGTTHFTETIPQLASNSPALLNAIFAISAKHLSLMGKLDESVCLRYIDACYNALIPELQHRAFECEHLAAVLILRLVMSMTDPAEVGAGGNIFLGLDVFISAWKAHPDSSLHASIFMNVLRLYIHVAWVEKTSLPEAEESCHWMEAALAGPNTEARVENCKITLQTARCLNFAYSDKPKTWEKWLELKRVSDEWRFGKPKYFNPLFAEQPMEGDPFPKRLFATDLYAFTHQTYSLARMLLLNHQPSTPPPAHLSIVVPLTQRQIDDETFVLTRKVLGTATSHAESAIPFISTLAVSYAGHLLTDRLSQEHAYGILHKAQQQVAGLTPAEEFTRLRQIWGWDVSYANILSVV